MSSGLRRAALAAALLGASPWLAGLALQVWGDFKAQPPITFRIEAVEQAPPPKLSGGPHLPKGKTVILEAGQSERWRCLVEHQVGFPLRQVKRLHRLATGQAAWILQGQGPELTTRVPDFGLARRPLVLEATGYDPGPVDNTRGWVGSTKSGERARFGIVAVDPKLIPLGSYLYIEGYGPGLAADIGGAIKGKRIDLCFNSTREANAWGRKKTRVWRIDPLHGAARKRWEEALALSLLH